MTDYKDFANFFIVYEDDEELSGWYISMEIGGEEFDLGPEPGEENGFDTVDEAFAHIAKWSADRGVTFHRPIITAKAVKES